MTMSDRIEIKTQGLDGFHYGVKIVQHWQLFFDGEFLSDTTIPEHVAKWKELKALVDGEEYMEPCRGCGRKDLPLHIDYLCPECHILTDDEHQSFVADLDYGNSTLTIRASAEATQALEDSRYENGLPIMRRIGDT